MSSFFDLDISFEDDGELPDTSKMPAATLKAAIDTLPEPLAAVAMGVLCIRQSELVSRLHRAQLAIGMYLMSQGRPGH
jgi:hypothetical protein